MATEKRTKGLMRILGCACWGMLLVSGCSRSSAPLAPVSGEVFFQGKPLSGGTIVFTPDPERGRGPLAWAEIKPDGRFVLESAGRKGAVPGWHKITVAPGKDDRSRRFPARYLDPDLSGQMFEVKPDRANSCTLQLQ